MTAPANDNWADAIVLSGTLPITRSGDTNVDATLESGEPLKFNYGETDPADEGEYVESSVWYSWTCGTTGTYRFRIDTEYDLGLTAYTGSTLEGLTRIAQSDVDYFDPFYEVVYFDATGGTTYHFQVAGFGWGDGSIDLELSAFTRPANDDFADAIELTGTSDTVSGSNVGASVEAGEPLGEYDVFGTEYAYMTKTVWYKWTAPSTLDVTLELSSDSEEWLRSHMGVYTGSSVSGLTAVAPIYSSFNFTAVAGTTYRIQVGSAPADGIDEGDFTLTLSTTAPDNDDWLVPQLITLSGGSATVTDDTTTATTETGEPVTFAGYEGTITSSVWFQWDATEAGVAVFDTFGSDFDTTAAAFTGGSVSGLSLLAFNDDYLGGTATIPQSQISWAAEADETYFVQVGGTVSGSVTAHLYFEPYPAPDTPDTPPELTPADDYRIELRSLSSSGFSQTTASLDLVTFSCNWRLNAPGAFEGTGVLGTIQTDAANVGQRELIVYKGDTAIWGGYLTFFDADEDSRRVRISAGGYWSRARSRVMRGNQLYKPLTNNGVSWKADVIAWDIIDQAQGGTYGDMGWSFGGHTGTRYDCKRVYYAVDRTNVAEAIEALAREDYFDFSLDVKNSPTAGNVAKFRTWSKRCTDRSSTIDLNGSNSVTLNYSLSSSDLYTYIDVFGSVEGCRGVAATDSANLSTYGRLEGRPIDMETDEQGEVDRTASEFIDQHSVPAKNASVTYMEGIGPDLTAYDIGDTIKVSPADGYVSYFTGRVVSRELAVEARRAVITVEVER